MAIKINNSCVICNACLPECPNSAIYEPGTEWAMKDGTAVTGQYRLMDGTITDADKLHLPFENNYYTRLK